ncbi:hypothetical protein FY528_09475 [Hymenobacter lutimineralis]|uniref:DUF3592 domain-containing protein n=1 Tax=Hymenobacter lutimineralis TaxID=2606448 RepID=A0A5D6V3F8_9BACT|nr:hypothetical protein [Hymenobacter lutimineralis]TYZ10086.1 hypothetical protein FY528_09475 [Hymenobacter lutimineralis]
MDNAEQEWPGKLKAALFSILLVVGAFYVYGQENEKFLLNTAPVKLGTIKELKIDRRGKGRPRYYVFLRLLPFINTDSLVEVKVDWLQFQRLRASDTLAVHYSLQSQKASISPQPAPFIGHWLLAGGLFFAGSLLPGRWKERLLPRLNPWLWRSAVFLLGGCMLGVGLKGCAEWAGLYSHLQPYHTGYHLPGRVLAASPTDSFPAALVAFHPVEDTSGATAYTRWMPLPSFYHSMFQEALKLNWKPPVEVWYPTYHKEKARLLVEIKPDDADTLQMEYFFMFAGGFILLIVQINPLEKLWKQRANSMD